MKKLFFLIQVAFCTILIYSCQSYKPPQTYQFDKSKVINKSFDDVWNKIIKWFGNNNTPIKTIEKASGLISTDFNLSADNIKNAMDCGVFKQNNNEIFVDYSGNFNIVVEEVNETSTRVTINAFFFSFEGEAVSENIVSYKFVKTNKSKKINCNSTGYLEKELFDFIEK